MSEQKQRQLSRRSKQCQAKVEQDGELSPVCFLQDNEQDRIPSNNKSQILERVKPDRVTVTKPEEDRRRRTIIVEKNNSGSFGFTLQSYGIHYKKEQEIEMITYVDFVEYDGPAYRAGMREGDVILSINGHDMEKTDHKTLVNFIKNCDGRMRMVVLFEDCVRKVALHMRYIELQSLLQSKMSELERLCVREKELLEGKWKTHSLPARKKGGKSTDPINSIENGESGGYCRPTVSTEDMGRGTPPPVYGPPLVMVYPGYSQFLDQNGRAYIIRPARGSSDYLPWPSIYQSRSESGSGSGQGVVRRCSASSAQGHESRSCHQSKEVTSTPTAKQKSRSSSQKSHHCNPCMQSATSPQDNTSLEAYDLASPCCNSQCVPSRRRKHHHKSKKSSSTQSDRGDSKEKNCNRSGPNCPSSGYSSSGSNQGSHRHHHHHQNGRRYFNLVSQCSLHSCTSSEMNSSGDRPGRGEHDSSAASYTTSLSTDTLFWVEGGHGEVTRQHSVKSTTSHREAKPKSWDNLTTKAFGGYGFGYGYVERKPPKCLPNKSSESLLLLPDYSDSSLCECAVSEASHSKDKASQTERRVASQPQAPEITRL